MFAVLQINDAVRLHRVMYTTNVKIPRAAGFLPYQSLTKP